VPFFICISSEKEQEGQEVISLYRLAGLRIKGGKERKTEERLCHQDSSIIFYQKGNSDAGAKRCLFTSTLLLKLQ
jgi:hypothetical protein